MGTLSKTKLVQSDLANPKAIAGAWAMKDNTPEAIPMGHAEVVGTIVGNVSGVKVRAGKAKDGVTNEYSLALEGSFEGMPTDTKRDTITSGILYLSEAFMSPIIAQFGSFDFVKEEWTDAPNRPRAISIVTEVLLIRDKNVHGYTWALRPVQQPDAVDPLAALKALLPKPGDKPQIADKSSDAGKAKAKT